MNTPQRLNGLLIRLFYILSLCAVVWTQSGCGKLTEQRIKERPGCTTLDKSRSPELLGFRLGMSREQILSRFSGLRIRDPIKSFTYTELFLSGSRTLPEDQDVSATDELGRSYVNALRFPEFADVNGVKLRFNDGHVSLVEVTYPMNDSRWETEEEFVAYVAQNFHLPDPKEWRHRSEMPSYSVKCEGFSVQAGFRLIAGSGPAGPVAVAFPVIVVVDEVALK